MNAASQEILPYVAQPRQDTGLYNAKVGIWLFLGSEVMLFGALFSSYILLRVGTPEGYWPHGWLNIPVGTLTLAQASKNVIFNGNLNASGTAATTGSVLTNRPFYTDAALTTLLNTSNYDLTTVGNDLYIDDGAGGSSLAIQGGAGTIITISNVEKGGKDLGTHSFAFSAAPVAGVDDNGATLQDFMDFLDNVLGLDNTTVGAQALGGGLSFSNGVITITGNEGTAQDLVIDTSDIVASNNGAGVSQPMVMSKSGSSDGESVRTSFVVYDSLGSPLTVDLTMVLQATTPGGGSTWEWLAESSDNNALDRIVGLGAVTFDDTGKFVSATNQSFSVTRTNGAVSPLTVSMDFNSLLNYATSLVLLYGWTLVAAGAFALAENIVRGVFAQRAAPGTGEPERRN